jgi:quinol monooxygenase YgiN
MPSATKAVAKVRTALLVRLQAKPGKEAEVAKFLEGGLPIVEQEPATITWYAIKLGPSTFGIFDTFPDDAGRQAHLGGKVAAALMAQAPELLASDPSIEKVEILAAKLPGDHSWARTRTLLIQTGPLSLPQFQQLANI